MIAQNPFHHFANFGGVAKLDDIQYQSWGMSVLGSGVIAEGLASLRQCISIILRTSLGSDPMRPYFGSEIFKYADAPVTLAIPNVKACILTALAQWEKRIEVTNVAHNLLGLGHIEYGITYTIVDSDISDTILFDIFNGGVTDTASALTLQAFFPPGIDTKRNYISFSLNNADVLPTPPIVGFSNIGETLAWVTANWGSYGKWFALADRMVCYLNSTDYVQASISLSVSSATQFSANIPNLSPNSNYKVAFNPDNKGEIIAPLFNTKNDLLIWLRSNWQNYGSWIIENGLLQLGEFNSDFDNDFNTAGTSYVLVLYSNNVTSASLLITSI